MTLKIIDANKTRKCTYSLPTKNDYCVCSDLKMLIYEWF